MLFNAFSFSPVYDRATEDNFFDRNSSVLTTHASIRQAQLATTETRSASVSSVYAQRKSLCTSLCPDDPDRRDAMNLLQERAS